jgi:hypothetical protein
MGSKPCFSSCGEFDEEVVKTAGYTPSHAAWLSRHLMVMIRWTNKEEMMDDGAGLDDGGSSRWRVDGVTIQFPCCLLPSVHRSQQPGG